MTARAARILFLIGAIGAGVACGGGAQAPSPTPEATTTPAGTAPAPETEEPLPPSRLETQLDEGIRAFVGESFTGDLDQMVKRRLVRIGVVPNRTHYFVDKGVQRGIAYDYGQLVEDRLNARFNSDKKHDRKIHVFFVPLTRGMLLPALLDGRVDLIAAQVTVRSSKQESVDFTNPTRSNVSEVVVTGPGGAPVASVDDLAGRKVFVRKSSPYYESLEKLNEGLKAKGKPEVILKAAPENLEDDDLLEMVNAGLIPMTVVDDYLAQFWKRVLPGLIVHENVTVRTGGTLGVAVRKDNPKLKAALNQFLGKYGLGSSFGNQIERKYLVSTNYARNAASDAERQRFLAIVDLFRKYGDRYDMDFLLMGAQGYQESALRQDAKSHVGAIGVMQLMPATGKEMAVGDIAQLEPNIHAGVKYMRRLLDTYYANEPMDRLNKGLFTFASYNAGPGRVRQLRREAEKQGLDRNVWFGNVESVAAERIGRETVTYVSNIYKYYVAYRLLMEEREGRAAAQEQLKEEAAK
jgi:membrane-bound lytic murein transglycosylase MltF